MQNPIMMATFSTFEWKYSFWVNLVSKFKVVCLKSNLVLTLIRICGIQWRCSVFPFLTRNTNLIKFGPRNQNCQFKLKFSTYRPWDLKNVVLNSIEKVKPGFLLSLMCMFSESNGTKFWSYCFHLQNSGIFQTRMNQRGHPMKMNFDNFQMQKWIS